MLKATKVYGTLKTNGNLEKSRKFMVMGQLRTIRRFRAVIKLRKNKIQGNGAT